MFQLAPQGVRGPVCPELPPTLLPHAIAAAAPPRERGRRLVLAGAVYLLLAGSGVFLSRIQTPVPLAPPQAAQPPTVIQEWDLRPAAETLPRVILAPGPAAADAGVHEAQRPFARLPDAVPEGVPSGLPTVDHHGDLQTGSAATDPASTAHAVGGGLGAGPARFFDARSLRVLRQVDPVYPPFARLARIQGVVVLLMTIDEAGVPTDVKVLEGQPALQAEALSAARRWRFEPARVDGRPVPATFRLTLNFRLK